MASPGPFTAPRADLDPFLFAEVVTEPNGMALTVLSMLARYGEDPWEEAAYLCTLRETDARDELAQIILQSQTRGCGLAEATAVAAQLIRLLPAHCETEAAARSMSPDISWIGTALLYGVLGASLLLNTVAHRARTADTGASSQAGAPIEAPDSPRAPR